jgi:hypothetical protein
VDFLRRLLVSVGFGLFVTAFWIFGFAQDQWSGDFLGTGGGTPYLPSLVVFLCTTGIVSLIAFAHQTRTERKEQRQWEARKRAKEEDSRRIAAIPQESREQTARTNLELAHEAGRDVWRARRQLMHQHDSIDYLYYAETEQSLRLTEDWISELVGGFSHKALSSGDQPDGRLRMHALLAEETAGTSLEDVVASIRSAESRLAAIDQTMEDYVGPQLSAAAESLGRAREWVEEALESATSPTEVEPPD